MNRAGLSDSCRALVCLSFNRGEALALPLLFGPLRRLPAEAFHRHASSPLRSPSARMSFGLQLFRSQSPVRSWRFTPSVMEENKRHTRLFPTEWPTIRPESSNPLRIDERGNPAPNM